MERLEGCKAALMRHMIMLKRRDLEEVCATAHMVPAPLPPINAAAEACGGAAASAQACPVPPSVSTYSNVHEELRLASRLEVHASAVHLASRQGP